MAAVAAAGRGGDRQRILSLALGHEVLSAGLVSAIAWWAPGPTFRFGLSPICLFLPIYPALAPLSLRMTLTAGLLAATTDVAGWTVALARGVAPPGDPLQIFWAFSTTYVCAILSVLPATIIRRLGRAVQEARDMGAYRLENLIGKGGMGEVYRASHRLLARPAAVKVISRRRLGEMNSETRTRALERFRREAAVAAALTSPHTISLFDFGITDSGTYYYVMELLQGMDLQAMVDKHGPLPPARAIHFLGQTAISLAEAHQFGIVHRDMKPSNVYAARLGLEVDFVKVLDFGVVKVETAKASEEALKLSREDVPIGTPAYMAPEGIDGGGALTPRSDIYSLGCVAFFLLTGEMVFHASSVLQMAMKHMEAVPRRPSEVQPNNGIPPELDALVLKCLSKRPGGSSGRWPRLPHRPGPARAGAALESGPGARMVEDEPAGRAGRDVSQPLWDYSEAGPDRPPGPRQRLSARDLPAALRGNPERVSRGVPAAPRALARYRPAAGGGRVVGIARRRPRGGVAGTPARAGHRRSGTPSARWPRCSPRSRPGPWSAPSSCSTRPSLPRG